jgi:hypothetical protein
MEGYKMKFSRTKQTVKISINWNDKTSVKNGKNLAQSFEKKGFFLYSQSMGNEFDTFVYKKF